MRKPMHGTASGMIKMGYPYSYHSSGPVGYDCPVPGCDSTLDVWDEPREGKVWECGCENNHNFQAVTLGGGDFEFYSDD